MEIQQSNDNDVDTNVENPIKINEQLKRKNLNIRKISHLSILLRTKSLNLSDPDYLDQKIALRLVFEKYSIPLKGFVGPEELRKFFKFEQNERKSLETCRKMIMEQEDQSEELTLKGFYKLLAKQEFDIFNPLHKKQCQSLNKSLSHYYVATSTMIRYQNNEDNNLNREKNIIGIYRDLLNICRCFQLKTVWDEQNNDIGVVILSDNEEEMIGINLQTLLSDFLRNAFTYKTFNNKNNENNNNNEPNQLPIIFNIDCQDLIQKKKMNNLIMIIENTFHESEIYNANSETSYFNFNCLNCCTSGPELPTLKSLKGKFVIIFKNHPIGNECSINRFYREETIGLDWNEIMIEKQTKKFGVLTQHLNEIDPLTSTISIDKVELPRLIKKYSEESMEDYWPSVTNKILTTINYNTNNDDYNYSDIPIVPSLIRLGVQTICNQNYKTNQNQNDESTMINYQCAKALFELNGQCGYVLKPKSLRKGKLYCIGFTEDKSLKDEPPFGPTRFMLRILSAQNVMKFNEQNPMKAQVVVKIFGHKDDTFIYETKICSSDGQFPFWNEQTRPVIRLPNFVFVYFQLKNNGILIGHRMLSLKSIIKGNRFVQLLDPVSNELIPEAKLFVHVNYKKIADSWSPDSNDFSSIMISDDENENDSDNSDFEKILNK